MLTDEQKEGLKTCRAADIPIEDIAQKFSFTTCMVQERRLCYNHMERRIRAGGGDTNLVLLR